MSATLKAKRPLFAVAMKSYVEDLMKVWDIPGVSLAIVKRDELSGSFHQESRGFGIRNQAGESMDEHTLLPIASNSKVYVVLAVGLLIEKGTEYTSLSEPLKGERKVLSWETKLIDIVPDWQLTDPIASAQANFVDLLSHMTGLPRHDDFYPLGTDPIHLVSRLRYLKPSAEFRQCQQYNNMTYHVMTLIPFITTGQDYISFVYEHILQPLGMNATVFGDDAQGKTNLSDGWYKTDLRQDLCLSEAAAGMKEPSARCLGSAKSGGKHSPSTRGLAMAGSVGILSNAHDLSIWLQTLLSDGRSPTSGQQILPRCVLEAIYTPRSVTAPGSMPGFGLGKQWPEVSTGMYGLGQWTYHYRGHKVPEGTGSVPGFRSAVVHLPDDGFGVAIVANDDTMGGLAAWVALKFRLIDEMLGLDVIDWKSRMWNCALDGMRDHARIVDGTSKGNPTKLDLNRVQGVYHHAAYGSIEICLRRDSVPHLQIPTSASSSDLLKNLPFRTKNPSQPEFIIRSSSAWADYLRLTHLDSDVFKLEFVGCWEETGLVTVDMLDSWYNSNVVKFVEDGIWFGGNYWGAETGNMGTLDEKSVRDDADVVFRKVD